MSDLIKNNIKVFFINVIISLMGFGIFILVRSNTPRLTTSTTVKNYSLVLTSVALIILIGSMILYYFAARLFFTCMGNNIKNILSVSMLGIIGIVWWAILVLFVANKGEVLNYLQWFYYCIFNTYALPLITDMNINNVYILLIFPILPVLVMGTGLIEKNTVKRKRLESKEI